MCRQYVKICNYVDEANVLLYCDRVSLSKLETSFSLSRSEIYVIKDVIETLKYADADKTLVQKIVLVCIYKI